MSRMGAERGSGRTVMGMNGDKSRPRAQLALWLGGAIGAMVMGLGLLLWNADRTQDPLGSIYPPQCLEECVIARTIRLGSEIGPGEAMRVLERAVKERPELSQGCHGAAHALGMLAAVDTYPEQVEISCGYGYLHGVLQARAAAEGSVFAAGAEKFCDRFDAIADGNLWSECTHGIGHGVAIADKSDILKSLEQCGTLTDSGAATCANGVMMEYSEGDNGEASEFSPEGPKYTSIPNGYDTDTLCARAPENTKKSCYQMLWSLQYIKYGNDLERAVLSCTRETDQDLHEACIGGFSRYVIETVRQGRGNAWTDANQQEYVRLVIVGCNELDLPGTCLREAAYAIYSTHYFSNNTLDGAPALCESAPDRHRASCLDGRDRARSMYLERE